MAVWPDAPTSAEEGAAIPRRHWKAITDGGLRDVAAGGQKVWETLVRSERVDAYLAEVVPTLGASAARRTRFAKRAGERAAATGTGMEPRGSTPPTPPRIWVPYTAVREFKRRDGISTELDCLSLGRHECAGLLTLSVVRAFVGKPTTMPSADFCAAMTVLAEPLSPGSPDTTQTSRGKTNRLHRTPAGLTTPALDGDGLHDHWLARPTG